MPGVMFSKSAAKRIGDAVRKIERIPGGEQDLQRQRAGGLGRMTLWEVIAIGYPIVGVDTGTEAFVVDGDHTTRFLVGDGFSVIDSTGNDGEYTVASRSYASGPDKTTIVVNEDITDATVDGKILTDPGTVTIKRVSNIDFDLNDLSEKFGILHDPDNEPLVGDQGLLIRLGNGNLFFFRRDIGPTIVYLTDYRYISDDFPDTNFGSNGRDSEAILDTRVGFVKEHRGIMKFTRQITASDPIFDHVMLRRVKQVSARVKDNDSALTGSDITFRLDVYKITKDFTPSLVTWNNYGLLTKTKVSNDADSLIKVGAFSVVVAEHPTGFTDLPDFYMGLWRGATGTSQKWDLSSAYGLSFHIVVKSSNGTPAEYFATAGFRRGVFFNASYPDSYVIEGLESTFIGT